MSQRIYCISGLGADEKVFSQLKLSNCELIFLQWIPPQENETVQSYAKQIAAFITDGHPVLLGVSFGGIVAVEIAKLIHVEKLFLVSTPVTKDEQPWWMRFAGKLRLHKLVKPKPHPLLYPIENYFLGTSSKAERRMANHFRKHIDGRFMHWAINEIVTWNNVTKPANCIQIHGTNDKLFPVRKVRTAHIVKGGGHFMIYNKAAEISSIILNELQLRKQ
ncbi:alpha/beta hydrolase [Lacibacter luteus]|uniref:Alpha/beta hydrolase n=1 Tax=Lacibacter luteus TaxID=2508719 RepID=A0A4Q1CM17_9BACT|nr:alpha/beta hydrolase [Lacibacter luteus]RXK61814.1 alpha/beta hydrolase [Lacibacter luteus]